MLRLPVLRLLERFAALARRIGFGPLVDRGRARALRQLGDFSERVGEITLTGNVAMHSHYVRQLTESERESKTVRLFEASIRPGSVVLDVGAHLGHFSLIAAVRGAQVVAFEPNPQTLPYLRRNLELNGVVDRVRVVPRAAGAEPGQATFFLSPAGDESSLHATTGTPVTVEVVPVDAETPGLIADVIKIDVEGAEPAVLAGMGRTLAEASPNLVLFVEKNPGALRRAGRSPEDLEIALREHGLTIEEAEEDADGSYVNLVCRRA